MSDTVSLTIDGQTVEVPKGTMLVEAAKLAGIDIPVFCHHPKLKPVGACRMCLVEIEKMPRLQTACTSPVADGMVVHTNTPAVVGAQNGVIELLLANHPLDCPICDKGGECPLQDNTFKFGRGTSRFREDKRKLAKALPLSNRIILDRERCIMCYRCVRFQAEIPGDGKLAVINRGGMSQIGVLEGETFDSPFSGNTIDLCPVGALTSAQYRFRSRPWDLKRTPSVCVGCSVGCNIEVHSREDQIKRIVPRENMAINNEWLCDRGRFDTLPIDGERIHQAMIDDRPVSWKDALEAAATKLRAGAVAIAASPSITNEALNVLKSIAGTLKAPLGVWPASTGRVRGTISDLVASKTIVLVDLDLWTELPVLALRAREAIAAGARLYFVGSRSNGLQRDTAGRFDTVEALLAAKPDMPGPVSVLGRGVEDLATQLEATGLVGSPALAANGFALSDLSPARFNADVCLLVGNESWPVGGMKDEGRGPRSIVSLRWTPNPGLRTVDSILLPIMHPYEQTGTLTNIEGRAQALKPGASAPKEAKADWLALTELAAVLGATPVGGVTPLENAIA